MRRRLLVTAAVVGALSFAKSAAADDPSVEELKRRGNQAMLDLNYVDALAAYRAALAKSPYDVVLYYNIGRAQQARGDYPAALDALQEFEKTAPPETKSKVPALGQLIADVKSHVGELRVRCTTAIDKAAILVDGTKIAEGCPAEPKTIRITVEKKNAKVEVKVESEAYQAPAVVVPIEGGGPPVNVTVSVQPKATSGIVRVVTVPNAAFVKVDGEERGNAPLEVSLRSGSHVLDVDAEGHEPSHLPFVLEAGSRRELNVTLEKTTPVTKKWWFWTGVGVVSAAVVTTAVILIVQPERDATPGSIPPNIVHAPLTTF